MDFAGHVPNYVNPESLAGTVLVANISCCAIATTFACVRLFIRIKVLNSAGWDDFAAAVATALFIVNSVFTGICTRYGFGKHIWDIKPEFVTPQLKLAFAIGCINTIGLMAVKLSILLSYLRIFSSPTFRKFVFGVIALTVTGSMAFTLASLLRCTPIAFYWDPTIPGGSCINQQKLIYLNGVFSVITDLMIWVLPIPILKNLELKRRKKYALFLAFSFGLFACIVSVVRLQMLGNAGISPDATWSNVETNTWTQIEMCAAITCACLPPLKAIFSRLVSSVFGSVFSSRTGTYVNSGNSNIHNVRDVYALHPLPKDGTPKNPFAGASEEEILGTGSAIDIESGMAQGAANVTPSLGPQSQNKT